MNNGVSYSSLRCISHRTAAINSTYRGIFQTTLLHVDHCPLPFGILMIDRAHGPLVPRSPPMATLIILIGYRIWLRK